MKYADGKYVLIGDEVTVPLGFRSDMFGNGNRSGIIIATNLSSLRVEIEGTVKTLHEHMRTFEVMIRGSNENEPIMKQANTSSKATIPSIEALDLRSIVDGVSRKDPLQFCTVTDEGGKELRYVAVDEEFLHKAEQVKLDCPANQVIKTLPYYGTVFFTKEHFAGWVRWAKRVRAAEWDSESCTVEYSTPKI